LALHVLQGRDADPVGELAALVETVFQVGDSARCRPVKALFSEKNPG
jgi:hypothetical protein